MNNKLHSIIQFVKHFLLATRKGHSVHSPFAYTLCEEVFYNKELFYDFKDLAIIRKKLQEDVTPLVIDDLGAGSHKLNTKTRKIKDITRHGISSQEQAELFYRLINFLKPSNILELGTSIGLTTLYFAKAAPYAKIYTLEGSGALLNFAKELAAKNKVSNIIFREGPFDSTLQTTLSELKNPDLIYLDGNHTYEATVRYLETSLQYHHAGSVFVFDDIYWSPQMTKAWKQIQKHPSVKMSLDLFYFGIIFFRSEIKEKVDLKLFI